MDSKTVGSRIRTWSVRILGTLAILAVAGALYVIVTDSLEDGKGKRHHHHKAKAEKKDVPAEYTVQFGDTVAGIAESQGVPEERILRLNPEVDPQALPSGAVLKLK